MVLYFFTNQSLLNCKVWRKSVTMRGRRLLYLKIYFKQYYDRAINSFKAFMEIRCYNDELKIKKIILWGYTPCVFDYAWFSILLIKMVHVQLQLIPSSHKSPFHPAAHPLSQWPVTWIQEIPSLQCPTHIWVQLIPYQPSLHSVIQKNAATILYNI